MFSFLALGKRVTMSLSGSLWWSFKFCVCLGLLYKRVTRDGKEICNPGPPVMWLSSLRAPVEHADPTTQLSHPPQTPTYFMLSNAQRMSPTLSDAPVVYLRGGSAYVLIWSLYAWSWSSSFPSFPLQATNVGSRERGKYWNSIILDAAEPESQ